MKTLILANMIACVLCGGVLLGCSGGKSVASSNETGASRADFVIRVQSSFGDIQQVEATVEAWMIAGVDQRPFDQKMTPFDIALVAGDFTLQLSTAGPGPGLKVQVLQNGNLTGFVQSKNVCLYGTEEGNIEIKNCMTGLR